LKIFEERGYMLDPERIDKEIRPITMTLLEATTEIKREWIVALLMDLDTMMTWANQDDNLRILQDVKDIMERKLQLGYWSHI
jgi:hypothetical protein